MGIAGIWRSQHAWREKEMDNEYCMTKEDDVHKKEAWQCVAGVVSTE